MLETPKQDWQLYDKKCRRKHVQWLRSLTPDKALSLYEELHFLATSQEAHGFKSTPLAKLHWREKLSIRRKMRACFSDPALRKNEKRNSENSH